VSVTNTSFFQDQVFKFIEKESSFTQMKRIFAYWVRFKNILNSKSVRPSGPITIQEIEEATRIIIRVVQADSFAKEIQQVKQRKSILSSVKLLTPFIDDFGILRVGGRLRNSFFSYQQRHPVLLPKNHHFTKIVLQHYHQTHHHAGPQLLLSLVREKFWIIRGPDMCSRIVRNCIICHKANPKPVNQLMGQLPEDRVKPSRPFSHVGIDYCGPFYLCLVKGRKPKIIKSYVSVFVCLAVKAIHLEFAGDLSTESFIGALKRFVARRGLPNSILCDGGRNFVGAKNQMEEFSKFISSPQHQGKVNKYFVDQEIKYKFNPPYSPHHGGIFEAAVKSMKHHLVRVVQDRHLTIEEFITLLSEIEATLNSRPITALTNDPNDFDFLTPSHFLIGGPLKAVPQDNLTDVKAHYLSRWQHVQQMAQHFNMRWSTQYLQSLQRSTKWYELQPNLGVGQLVLLSDLESSIGTRRWRLGRIVAVHHRKDGLIRVCDVAVPVTTNNQVKVHVYRRPITKISSLPLEN